MDDTIRWLITVVIAFSGVGLALFYQGKALMKPEESKKVGRQLYVVGAVWVGLAVFWLFVALLFTYLA